MMLVVVLLKTMEVAPFGFGGIDVVKRIVTEVVNHVSNLEASPEEHRENRIIEFHQLANREVPKREDDAVKRRRQHKPISTQTQQLRIIRQHMMYPMRKEVKIMSNPTIRDISVTMKDKPVKAILYQAKEDQARNSSKDGQLKAKSVPTFQLPKHVRYNDGGHKRNNLPSGMRESVNPIGLEHLRRVSEQPIWRLHDMQVLLMIQLPYLSEERIVRVDESLDILLEGADGHGVGHVDSQRMMKLHLLLDILQVVVFEQECTAWMMRREGSSIEDVVLEDKEAFLGLLCVLLDLLGRGEPQQGEGLCHLLHCFFMKL